MADKVRLMPNALLTEGFSFQIITKEVEVNNWKKKYEQCKQEVEEMRLDYKLLQAFSCRGRETFSTRVWQRKDTSDVYIDKV